MKNVLYLLIGFTLTTITGLQAAAATAKAEQTAPASGPDCQTRSLKLTCYYTDALRLSSSQAAAVKQATLLELQQLEQLVEQSKVGATELEKPRSRTEAQIVAQYDAAMLRILTPGQYSSFHLLQERQASLRLLLPDQVARK